jgi:hypothetical protein
MAGFVLGLLGFLALNLAAAGLTSECGLPAVLGMDRCADDIVRAGWPVRFYEEGGIAFHSSFGVLPLTVDAAIGLLLAGAAGWWRLKWRRDAQQTS